MDSNSKAVISVFTWQQYIPALLLLHICIFSMWVNNNTYVTHFWCFMYYCLAFFSWDFQEQQQSWTHWLLSCVLKASGSRTKGVKFNSGMTLKDGFMFVCLFVCFQTRWKLRAPVPSYLFMSLSWDHELITLEITNLVDLWWLWIDLI